MQLGTTEFKFDFTTSNQEVSKLDFSLLPKFTFDKPITTGFSFDTKKQDVEMSDVYVFSHEFTDKERNRVMKAYSYLLKDIQHKLIEIKYNRTIDLFEIQVNFPEHNFYLIDKKITSWNKSHTDVNSLMITITNIFTMDSVKKYHIVVKKNSFYFIKNIY